jgi:RNA polymerase sigma-70 factor (ECF subfamily)
MEIDKEEKLIKNIQSGDLCCFEELYNIYKDLVYSVCLKFLDNKNEADDVSQDIFIKVYYNIKSFRFDSKFSTYLYKISVNHCLNLLRKERRVKLLSLDAIFSRSWPDNQVEISDESMDLEKIISQKEAEKIIGNAINSLPEKQKTAIILSKFEELSYSEIAAILGCTISSVESLLFRAKQNLSKKLYKYF